MTTLTTDELLFINSLIGKPWELGNQGPYKYDCWSLARTVEYKLFKRKMPIVDGAPTTTKGIIKFMREHSCRNDWKRIEAPVHGCMVEMAHNKHPFHVGVWLDVEGGGIIHCHEKAGVSWDRLITLEAMGWRRFIYHDWAN